MANAYKIIEDTLNFKATSVYDPGDDNEKPKLNPKETQIARSKQELIKNEFKNWLIADNERVKLI